MEKYFHYIQSKDLIWLIAILDMIVFDIFGVPGVHITLFCMVLGIAVTLENAERIISRLAIMAIATQVLWKASGVIDPNYINPIFAMMFAVIMIKVSYEEDKQCAKFRMIYLVLPLVFLLELQHIMTLFHFSILYFFGRSFIKGTVATLILAGLSGTWVSGISLPAGIVIFLLTQGLSCNIRIPQVIKYSIFPLHLILIYFIQKGV